MKEANSKDDPRTESLFRYLDGQATDADVHLLENAIVNDTKFRDLAVECFNIDSQLDQLRYTSNDASMSVERTIQPETLGNRWASRWKGWSMAATASTIMAVVVGIAVWATHTSHPNVSVAGVDAEFVKLENVVGLQIDGRHESNYDDQKSIQAIHFRQLQLNDGKLAMRLTSDVRLFLEGSCDLQFLDPMHVQVKHGKVTAEVGVQGIGFRMDTRQASVVDLGTVFGVDANKNGKTDVVVLQGKVHLIDHPNSTEKTVELQQGEAVRIDSQHYIARIANIVCGSNDEDWSTQPPPTACSIVKVNDNFLRDQESFYYRIFPRGLRNDVRLYVNHPQQIEEIPEELIGADFVQTFRAARKRATFQLEVECSRPTRLFVLMPKSGLTAGWLTQNFERMDKSLWLKSVDSAKRSRIAVEVWKRDIQSSGTIVLGETNRDQHGNPGLMYAIAAKPLSD